MRGDDARRIRDREAAPRREVVRSREHLQRPGDVEQLHVVEREHVHGAALGGGRRGWQESWGLWHIRHTVLAYSRVVHGAARAFGPA
ncbi:hypothetical protein [Burkholderia sp. ABCPW 14]|uniref:hypothetical protein n=1 Tax=Burkholderia sp. ABCPW 14 TaxID=1637860 RepID=UPI001E6262DC|nr:hypothetical protein [Burkholderia sp. ABCPW 14]